MHVRRGVANACMHVRVQALHSDKEVLESEKNSLQTREAQLQAQLVQLQVELTESVEQLESVRHGMRASSQRHYVIIISVCVK